MSPVGGGLKRRETVNPIVNSSFGILDGMTARDEKKGMLPKQMHSSWFGGPVWKE